MKKPWPAWVDRDAAVNLRQVGENLYVGAFAAHEKLGLWGGVVSFYAPRGEPRTRRHLYWPFEDGERFPEGCLTAVEAFCRDRQGPVLLHCAAGLSRSAAAAYAILCTHHRCSHEEALLRVRATPGYPLDETLLSAVDWVVRWNRKHRMK